jgi:hypothetical protein
LDPKLNGLLNFEPSSIQWCVEYVSFLYGLFEINFLNLLHHFKMPCMRGSDDDAQHSELLGFWIEVHWGQLFLRDPTE